MTRVVLDGCAVATVDDAGTEHRHGHLVVEDGRIASVGAGPAPRHLSDDASYVDATGCLLTPGLVNTHHHLYQWATRGHAVEAPLFDWLRALYPVWRGLDEDVVSAAATAALGWLARTGCTTTTDHHYVFPAHGGDLFAAEVEAAGRVGVRFHPCRGSMDLGESAGGLPPDDVVEGTDEALRRTDEAVARFHDPGPAAMVRVGVAPCSPFSVTETLMVEAAALARGRGVRLHTHLAETVEEQAYCRERFGLTPVQYAEKLGWLGPDVWFAHAVHLSPEDVDLLAGSGTGVATCPTSNARLGAGIAPVPELLEAGAPVGLGVDGAASNEAASAVEELRHVLLVARARGGPAALTSRQALRAATAGGARVLGRQEEIGSLEAGKLADLALWRLDGLGSAGIDDPVEALVLGPPPPLELLLVQGRPVVGDGHLLTVDEDAAARDVVRVRRRLLERAGAGGPA